MGRLGSNVSNLRVLSKLYFGLIVLCTIFLMFIVITFKTNFLNYQKEQVDNLKEEITQALKSDDLTKSIVELNEDYSFEIIVQEGNTILYTSNTLYDVENANNVYNDNFIYKEAYEENEYLVWIVVTSVDVVPFVNDYLVYGLIVVLVIIIATILFLRMLYLKSSKPILRTLEIVEKLKSDSNLGDIYDEQLDIVNEELLLLYNDISFRTYQLEQTQDEYQRINKAQKTLLEEQKTFLESVIHEIKSPLASINYSRFIVEKSVEDKSDDVEESLQNIKFQSEEALTMVVETLDSVRENSFEMFIEETEVDINSYVEQYFKKNKVILNQKHLDYNIVSENDFVFTNKLKFVQVLNNLLSNMLNYSKEETVLDISFSTEELVFRNFKGDKYNEYSTKYGNQRIVEIVKELGMELEVSDGNEVYEVKIRLGDYNV